MKKINLSVTLWIFLFFLICILSVTLFLNYKNRYVDYVESINYNLLQGNRSDIENIVILMNYSYWHVAGQCTEKSNGFELLAKTYGYKTEHMVFVTYNETRSHATTRVYINNTWLYVDSLYNKFFQPEEYLTTSNNSLGIKFDKMLRHINCYYNDCRNYNDYERVYYNLFYIKHLLP